MYKGMENSGILEYNKENTYDIKKGGLGMGYIVLIVIVLIIISYALAKSLENDKEKAIKGGYYDQWAETVDKAQWEVNHGKGYGIKCPNCGQVNVEKISTARRAVSVGVTGLASDKIGKTYKCPKCKYIW